MSTLTEESGGAILAFLPLMPQSVPGSSLLLERLRGRWRSGPLTCWFAVPGR